MHFFEALCHVRLAWMDTLLCHKNGAVDRRFPYFFASSFWDVTVLHSLYSVENKCGFFVLSYWFILVDTFVRVF